MSTEAVLAAIQRAPVLCELPDFHLLQLALAGSAVELRAQQVLWRTGEPAGRLGVLVRGRMALARRDYRGEVLVELVGPGELLGDVALALQRPYAFDAICLRRAQVIVLPSRAAYLALDASPVAQRALARQLARQVVRLSDRLESLACGKVEQRLARVLCGLVDRFGEASAGGVVVPVRLRRQELASLAATTVESTSRRLARWHRSGLVTPDPAGYRVNDPGALRRIADGLTAAARDPGATQPDGDAAGATAGQLG